MRSLSLLKNTLLLERVEHFEALKPWLSGDTDNISQAEAAARLGVNEGARSRSPFTASDAAFREEIKNRNWPDGERSRAGREFA